MKDIESQGSEALGWDDSNGDNIIGSLVEALKGSPKGGLKSSMWEGFALNRNQKTSAPNAYLTGEKLKC